MSKNPFDPSLSVEELAAIWEPRKEYIEKDLWVIRNFLTDEELRWLNEEANDPKDWYTTCLLYTSPSPRDGLLSRMPSSA